MLSVDRLEDGFAVCIDEEQNIRSIPLSLLPGSIREGDIIKETASGGFVTDDKLTESRRNAVLERTARLGAKSRRKGVLKELKSSCEAQSATALAKRFGVSRQIIVGDIALLRAAGEPVVATPRGYLLQGQDDAGESYTIACRHGHGDDLLRELYIIVDEGATALDVTVEHPVYGQITGLLQISSRFEANRFQETLKSSKAEPLSQLTGGIHLHTIRCPDRECFLRVVKALSEAGILVEN